MDRIETLFNEWLALSSAINANPSDDLESGEAMQRLLSIESEVLRTEAKTADDVRRQICIAFDNNATGGTTESSFIRQVRRDLGLDDDERRLDLLLQARRGSGMTLDFWADLTEGMDLAAVETLADRATLFPRHEEPKAKA